MAMAGPSLRRLGASLRRLSTSSAAAAAERSAYLRLVDQVARGGGPQQPRRAGRVAAAALAAAGGAVAGGCYLSDRDYFHANLSADDAEDVDALIIGGGIMGTTVAVMLKLLQPEWNIRLVEQLDRVGAEASNEWHNAGTGHAALCEANYTPANPKTGEVDISKAKVVNGKFNVSLSFWSWLVEKGLLPDGSFIQPAPHILFVHGATGVAWLRQRVEKLKKLPSFAATEYSEDFDTIQSWVGLLCSGRPRDGEEAIACSRHPDGTEVNYGLLTRNLAQSFAELGGTVQLLSRVVALEQQDDSRWLVAVQKNDLTQTNTVVRARYVFAGAGGGSLRILQKAKIPEIDGYAGMPVSGKFLVCQKPEVIEQNRNKVYGRAALGAPPMSVPHLDWRTIYGQDCIFFGPFAGFSPTIFKVGGSWFDWISTFNPGNVLPTALMAASNLPLVRYLMTEVFSSKAQQLAALREFVPDAKPEDWTMVWAGQRVQIVKPDGNGGASLQFGTEVVSSEDGTIVGLLGASPGASVSPSIAIEVLKKFNSAGRPWEAALRHMIPAYGRDINAEAGLYDKVMSKARAVLLQQPPTARANANSLFDRLDKSRKGRLTVKQLKEHLTLDPKQVDELLKKLDVGASGEISREKFDASYATFVTGQVRKLKTAMSMRAAPPASKRPAAEGPKKGQPTGGLPALDATPLQRDSLKDDDPAPTAIHKAARR